jgi:Holliday junction resolvase YEN1
MGINDLWKVCCMSICLYGLIVPQVLKPAVQTRTLTQLSVIEGFEANRGDKRALSIGVDARYEPFSSLDAWSANASPSIWLNQTQAVFEHAGLHAQAGENPELKVLFNRLCRLVLLPINVIFVFDGPQRPSIKRGKRVAVKAHWLIEGFKSFILAFGFHAHTVSGVFAFDTLLI